MIWIGIIIDRDRLYTENGLNNRVREPIGCRPRYGRARLDYPRQVEIEIENFASNKFKIRSNIYISREEYHIPQLYRK